MTLSRSNGQSILLRIGRWSLQPIFLKTPSCNRERNNLTKDARLQLVIDRRFSALFSLLRIKNPGDCHRLILEFTLTVYHFFPY